VIMPLPLHPRTRQELDRRGPVNVRAILDNPEWTGAGQNAEVRLHVAGVPNPERAQVELWLREKEQAANRNVVWIAVLTLIFAGIGAAGSVIAAWPIVKEWLK
jgi:anti-sigma factor RsiW